MCPARHWGNLEVTLQCPWDGPEADFAINLIHLRGVLRFTSGWPISTPAWYDIYLNAVYTDHHVADMPWQHTNQSL